MQPQGQTGKRIEDYVYNYSDFIGSGNFSKCYKATNTRTQQTVAIKIVALDSLKSRRLEELLHSEIEVLKQLDHPNLLRCLEVFSSNRNCYLITELCNQGDLETLFRRSSQQIPQKEVRSIAADVFSGLSYLASKDIIHRDLKIANIFMHNGVAKIADFGFAARCRYIENDCSGLFRDLNIGSPLYMSPQGIHSNLYGPKTDVWAFGVMLYQLYHGRTPFSNCLTEVDLKAGVLKQLRLQDLKASIPNDAKELILACMQVSQEKRPNIYQLADFNYIKQAIRQKEADKFLCLESPLRQHLLIKNNYPQLMHRGRERNNFKSQQPQRIVTRSVTPQRVIFNGALVNTSQQLKSTPRQNEQTTFNQTFSHSFQTPIQKRPNLSPAKPSNHCFYDGVMVTAFQVNQQQMSGIQIPEPKSHKNISQRAKQPYLISCPLNFKQSVSILHYCRLIFKYLTFFKEVYTLSDNMQKKIYAMLGFYLLSALQQMHAEVIKKRIKYDGSNPEIREKKLIEVLDEYRKKYGQELDQNIIKSSISIGQKASINLTSIKNSIQRRISDLRLPEEASNSQIITAQLQFILFTSTCLLQGCFLSRNYSKLHKNKAIEEVLNRNKDSFTYTDYLKQKEKIMVAMVASS